MSMRDSHAWAALIERTRFEPAGVVPAIVDVAAQELGGEAVVFLVDFAQSQLRPLLVDVEPLSIESTMAGRVFQTGEPLVHGGRQVLVPIVDGAHRLGVLCVSFPGDAGDELVAACLELAAVTAAVIVAKNGYSDSFHVARLRQDMNLAASLQWDLLPPLSTETPQVVVAGQLEPAYEVGGDLFDYAVNEDVVHLAVLDAMGHGLHASSMASIAVGAYRHARRLDGDLPAVAAAIDDAITTQFDDDCFVTGVIARLDPWTGELLWVNAGHPKPLLIRGQKVIGELECTPDLPFGLQTGARPVLNRGQLEPGDMLLLHSDGVVEARSGSDQFGMGRLVDHLERAVSTGLPPAEMNRRLARELLAYHGGKLTDDATLLLVTWRGAEPR